MDLSEALRDLAFDLSEGPARTSLRDLEFDLSEGPRVDLSEGPL